MNNTTWLLHDSGLDVASKDAILFLIKSITKEGNRSVVMSSNCLEDVKRRQSVCTLVLHCNSAHAALHDLFSALEEARALRHVLDYNVVNCSFEEVFRNLTTQQNDGTIIQSSHTVLEVNTTAPTNVWHGTDGTCNSTRSSTLANSKPSISFERLNRCSVYDNVDTTERHTESQTEKSVSSPDGGRDGGGGGDNGFPSTKF
ncbi:Asp/Glu racemase active site 1 [Trinorchestia longiramus]|nr:Asp/Glu racemase active site 1 [Trinorchestia longiramus]